MAAKHRVLASIETDAGERCVDVFLRADGTFGFEEYRSDPEDGRGWFPVQNYAALVFESEASARDAARRRVIWLGDFPPPAFMPKGQA